MSRSRLRWVLVVAALGSVAALVVHSAPAQACINELTATERLVMKLREAERLLSAGKHQAAAVAVISAYPAIRAASPDSDGRKLKALRILAMSAVRSDGAIASGPDWKRSTPEERAANVEWARTTLRRIGLHRVEDPAALTDLGEALARSPKHRDEARRILEYLAGKDLIAGPHAYAALAQLRNDDGQLAARDAAIRRCQQMAGKQKVRCRVERAVVSAGGSRT